jgi:hypothetical protein
VIQEDLFALANGPMLTPGQRKQLSTRSKKHGHAAAPGTGPAGETCGSCKYLAANRLARTYYKCDLMRVRWTGGYGTDVRVRDAACAKWEGRAVSSAHREGK